MKRFSLLTISIIFLICSCADPVDPTPTPNPNPDKDTTEVIPVKGFNLDCSSYFRFSPESKVDVHILLESGMEYDVVIPDDAGWVSTSTLHGDKSGYITFNIAGNTTGNSRSAIVEFKYGAAETKTIEITQKPKEKKDYFTEWGLKGTATETVSNDRQYNWYIDQGQTGPFGDVNCGPASATMCAKWYNSEYVKDTEAARKEYRPEGGWWYGTDIESFMTKHKIPFKNVDFSSVEVLKNELSKGKIAIINPDMYYISLLSSGKHHVDRFYMSDIGSGHYIVVKGFVQTDKKLYFEVYDPFSMGNCFSDKSFAGMDRYYAGEEVLNACQKWSTQMMVIQNPN